MQYKISIDLWPIIKDAVQEFFNLNCCTDLATVFESIQKVSYSFKTANFRAQKSDWKYFLLYNIKDETFYEFSNIVYIV